MADSKTVLPAEFSHPSIMIILSVLSSTRHARFKSRDIWRLKPNLNLAGVMVVPSYIKEVIDVLATCLISISTTVAMMFLAAKQSLSCPVGSAKAPN